jgi:hypothetical protein
MNPDPNFFPVMPAVAVPSAPLGSPTPSTAQPAAATASAALHYVARPTALPCLCPASDSASRTPPPTQLLPPGYLPGWHALAKHQDRAGDLSRVRQSRRLLDRTSSSPRSSFVRSSGFNTDIFYIAVLVRPDTIEALLVKRLFVTKKRIREGRQEAFPDAIQTGLHDVAPLHNTQHLCNTPRPDKAVRIIPFHSGAGLVRSWEPLYGHHPVSPA